MSYPPPPGQDPNNPYGQQPGYGYPQQGQQQPYGQQPGYGYPQGQQAGYGYPQQPGTLQANNGYINIGYLGTVKLATMGERFLARLLDGVIMSVVVSIVMFAGLAGTLGIAESTTNNCDPASPDYATCLNERTDESLGALGAMFAMMAVMSVFLLLYEWLMISTMGATLGKMALGIKVVNEGTGQPPGLGNGFVRYIIPVVGAFLCYIGMILVWLSPFFDNSGKLQGWHDRAANTLVIKTR
ncbi:RDD family protein [Streptomyces sp. NPDC005438]|uniref:RDD family protein n=1 Tax=Streptomyces sp. NPDC005438 TaxID=3156880 RepID=UPI0033B6C439